MVRFFRENSVFVYYWVYFFFSDFWSFLVGSNLGVRLFWGFLEFSNRNLGGDRVDRKKYGFYS